MILKISHIFVLACVLAFTNAAAIPSLPKGVAEEVQSENQNFLAQNLLNVEVVSSDFSASEDEFTAIEVITTRTPGPTITAKHYGNIGCLVFKKGYKVKKIFAQKSTYPKEIIRFELWCSGELSKIGHQFMK